MSRLRGRSAGPTSPLVGEVARRAGRGWAIGAAALGSLLLPVALDDFQLTIYIFIGLAAIVVAVGISALSGVLPAVRASRLDPVQAIRYE